MRYRISRKYPFRQEVEAMHQGRRKFALATPEIHWCRANLKGRFDAHYRGFSRIIGPNAPAATMLVMFRFERQEDAALFKLFWC